MKKIILILLTCLPVAAFAQIDRIGGGLKFSSGVNFNTTPTGNPAITGSAYIGMMERAHFVPSISIYNIKKRTTPENEFKNYMFQADMDIQYGLVKEGDLRLIAFGGLNMTGIISRHEMLLEVGQDFENDAGLKLGANIGATIEMYIDKYYDAFLSVKYIAGHWDQFVISIGVTYNLEGDRRRGW